MIPSPRTFRSRDKRLPLDTWNPEYRKTFWEINFLRMMRLKIFLRISSDDVQRNREAALGDPKVKTSLISEDGQNYGAIPMPMFVSRPLTTSSKHPVDIPQNCVVGQQRQQMSELQFDKFPNPQSFVVWKIRFKTYVTTCFDFPSEAVLWINEVEVVDSLDEAKILAIRFWK